MTATNDAPTAIDDDYATDEDTPLAVPADGVLGNDTNPNPGDGASVVELNGAASLTGTSAAGATVTISADCSLTYNPVPSPRALRR